MSSILRNNHVFGPIKSRRLGNSLGINLLPIDKKICNFNCIYCECGWNNDEVNKGINILNITFVSKDIIKQELNIALASCVPDSITFSGNGEPTLHPQFADIIDITIKLRNSITPSAKITVLSNGTTTLNPNVFSSLCKIENPIIKLDSANCNTIETMNLQYVNMDKTKSTGEIIKQHAIEGMKQFNGNFILQTMLLQGEINGKIVDNSTEEEIAQLLNVIKEVKPRQVMLYSIDRPTPALKLNKIDSDRMLQIVELMQNQGVNVLWV